MQRHQLKNLNWYYGKGAVDHFIKSLKKQKGKCAICGKRMKKPNLDHDHKSGKWRGLLCSSCNYGLGYFKDSIFNLQQALTYLRRYSKARSE